MTSRSAYLLIGISLLIAGCQSDELTQLREENNSLKHQLKTRVFLEKDVAELSALLDSIDRSRQAITANMKPATSLKEFKDRLTQINSYIKHSHEKLRSIENQLRRSRNEASAYTMMVDALKGEVDIRDGEVSDLTSAVTTFQQQNQFLLDSVKFHESRAVDMHVTMTEKQRQLSLLESKVHKLENDFRLTEAEVFYAKAQLLEEAARRMKLAPQKKKQTYTEALELYTKAFTLGKKEAKDNMILLEEMLSLKLTASASQASLHE
jgi:chromosome segregation ATPase